ncbi:MAG TPA: hypothetical protein VFB06_11155 [Streptosporangiaceae bacterium]|nr:hypothetical protein [Streptosporangiaceae bacterium]
MTPPARLHSVAEALSGLAADYKTMTAGQLADERVMVLREMAEAPEGQRDLIGRQLRVLEAEEARREADLDALAALRLAWGDWFEDIRTEMSPDGVLWKGRERGGDGCEFTAWSADGLNALFREALDRRERL